MESLEIRTKNKISHLPIYKKNIENVIVFLRHPEDKVIIKEGETINIEVYDNGKLIFAGDKYELFEKLKN